MPVHFSRNCAACRYIRRSSPIATGMLNQEMVEVASPLRLVYTAVCMDIFSRGMRRALLPYDAHENVKHMQTSPEALVDWVGGQGYTYRCCSSRTHGVSTIISNKC